MKTFLTAAVVVGGLASASPAQDADRPARTAQPAVQTPAGPPPNVGQLMLQNGGSLYRAALQIGDDPRLIKPGDVNYFAVPEPKPKTLLKHDLVTIIVSEQSEFSSDGTTDTKKSADLNARITQFPTFGLSNFALRNTIGSVVPEIGASGTRNYKGEGTVDRKDTFTMRIQAEVLDVKPNGRLVLQARKRIVTDEEDQLVVLSGECRVLDVTPDNTVLSNELYDLDIRKSHTGAVRDATKRGWIPRAIDWVNPF